MRLDPRLRGAFSTAEGTGPPPYQLDRKTPQRLRTSREHELLPWPGAACSLDRGYDGHQVREMVSTTTETSSWLTSSLRQGDSVDLDRAEVGRELPALPGSAGHTVGRTPKEGPPREAPRIPQGSGCSPGSENPVSSTGSPDTFPSPAPRTGVRERRGSPWDVRSLTGYPHCGSVWHLDVAVTSSW